MAANIRRFSATVALLCLAMGAHAAIGEYWDRATFAAALLASVTDDFADLSPGQVLPSPLTRVLGGFQYSAAATFAGELDTLFVLAASAPGGSDSWLSTDAAESVVTLDGFGAGTNGIGAAFFATDFPGGVIAAGSLTIVAQFAGGSITETITGGDPASFLGFVSNDQLLSLTVRAVQPVPVGGTVWLTLASPMLGTLAPVPEPSSAATLALGAVMLAWRRRMLRAKAVGNGS